MRTVRPLSLALLLALSLLPAARGPSGDPADSPAEWAASFWSAPTVEQRDLVAAQWLATGPAFDEVQAALIRGRRYPAEAPTGYVLRQRVGSSGRVHPYLILVPEDYTPERSWRVRLNLHGGMGAPEWAPEVADWAGGWNRASGEIMVHPAGWIDSMWWHPSQVENLDAILREVRATWNVDENRVVAVGNSDGGAALFFLAMRTPERFASYAGHVAPPDRLTRAAFEPDGQMHVGNLRAQRFLLGYGERDTLVPIKYIRKYMELFRSVGTDLEWYSLEGKGHTLDLSDERVAEFLEFIATSRRDPLPNRLTWSTEDPARFGRRSWLRIDQLAEFPARFKVDTEALLPRWGTQLQRRGPTVPRVPFGTVDLTRVGNRVEVTSTHVRRFTLLLSASEFDLSQPVEVVVNGEPVRTEVPGASCATLLHRAARDDDRTQLFGASWTIEAPE